MKVGRRTTFNAAHRLHNPEWTDEKNLEVFGKCSLPNYHGHNYVLETWVDGPIDPVTGYVFDLGKLKHLVHDLVLDKFDHRNLNIDCEEFRNLNPSAENIALVIWQKLRPHIDSSLKLSVKLFETENNFVEYDGK